MSETEIKSKKIPSIKQSVRNRGGFGLFIYSITDKEEKKSHQDAKECAEHLINELDKYLDNKFPNMTDLKDKRAFLHSLQYYLGGIIAGVCQSLGDKL